MSNCLPPVKFWGEDDQDGQDSDFFFELDFMLWIESIA